MDNNHNNDNNDNTINNSISETKLNENNLDGTNLDKTNQDETKLESNQHVFINFVNNRTKMLCDLYVKHFRMEGYGILYIGSKNNDNNVNVAFIKWQEVYLDIQKQILERKKVNNDNIIYFVIFDNKNKETILEIDIRDFI
tara:strand:+ start:114 stop:536 length:423 start_codon:yes stop_codon:yes gene_type:complete